MRSELIDYYKKVLPNRRGWLSAWVKSDRDIAERQKYIDRLNELISQSERALEWLEDDSNFTKP